MTRYRLTGGTVGPLGAQWERRDDDRVIAQRVLDVLADRRMLWRDFSLEIEERCARSATQARQDLARHMENPEISDDLATRVRALQALFRAFMDDLDRSGIDESVDRHRGYGTDPLSMALGRLRALIGVKIGELAALYDLQVSDDLATIVPDEDGWFFERFRPSGTSQ